MAKIAVIKTGGKQYLVSKGQTVKVEKLEGEAGNEVKFDTLLLAEDSGADIKTGRPSLGEQVTGKILEQGRHKKVNVMKYKSKVRYLRNTGHRQSFTKVEITTV